MFRQTKICFVSIVLLALAFVVILDDLVIFADF